MFRRHRLLLGLGIVLVLTLVFVAVSRISTAASSNPPSIEDWKREAAVTFTAKLSGDKAIVVNLSGGLGPSDEPLVMTYRATRLRVGEMESDPMDLGGGSRNIPNWAVQGGGSGDREIPLVKVPEKFAPGGQVNLICTVDIVISKPDDSWRPRETLAKFSTECTATVDVPPGFQPVRQIRDEAMHRKLEGELRVTPLEVRINDPNKPNYIQFRWNLTIDGPKAPINLGYDIKMRTGSETPWKIGEFTCAKGEQIHYELTKQGMAGRPAEKFDLILTPSAAAAATHDLQDISGDTIVIHDVPRKLIGVR